MFVILDMKDDKEKTGVTNSRGANIRAGGVGLKQMFLNISNGYETESISSGRVQHRTIGLSISQCR